MHVGLGWSAGREVVALAAHRPAVSPHQGLSAACAPTLPAPGLRQAGRPLRGLPWGAVLRGKREAHQVGACCSHARRWRAQARPPRLEQRVGAAGVSNQLPGRTGRNQRISSAGVFMPWGGAFPQRVGQGLRVPVQVGGRPPAGAPRRAGTLQAPPELLS